jgi:hypothetical protein
MRSKKGNGRVTKSLFSDRMRLNTNNRSIKKEEVYGVYRSDPELSKGDGEG